MDSDTGRILFGTSSMAIFYLIALAISSAPLSKAVTFLDHIGKMGNREIARSYPACLRVLLTAGGAGLITAGAVVLKMRIHASCDLLTGGALIAVNYAVSFLFMQAFGFRLATKISPLLGTALAKRLSELRASIRRRFALSRGPVRLSRLAGASLKEEIRWCMHTQAFGAFGNLAFVIGAAFAFHALFVLATGHPFLNPAAARATLGSLDPLETGTLAYASFTGVLLWICTIAAGAIASRFRTFSKTMATALFNIFLGFGLAFTPVIGQSLGLPLDIRHFTLSGGMVAIATAALGWRAALDAGLVPAFIGTLLIGLLNFSVSFALAFVLTWWNSDEEDRYLGPGIPVGMVTYPSS